MNSSRLCPVCGTDLPGDAPRGLCPQCLLAQAISIPAPKSSRPAQPPSSETPSPPGTRPEGREFHEPGRAAAPAAAAAPAQNPKIRYFGDYELLGEVAAGGMGVVYYARQISLNRTVALKMIRSGQLATADEVQRFRTEAEAAANLDHPHIVPIHEIGEHEGQHYFSMKLMEGGTLAELNASCGARTAEWARRAAQLVATVARAAHHAHQRGVLHRDIKPTNVLLDDQGQPHLTDFGLAKVLQGRADLTQSLAVMGTPGYMSPEQAAGKTKHLTTAADVYSLGAILYDLLTGRPPFQGSSTLEVLNEVQLKEPERPRKLNPRLERDLETICLKCLEKEPQRRYGTAEKLAEDLERWLAGEPIQARPVHALERAAKWTRRNPVVAALSATAVLILVAGVLGVLFEWRRAAANAARATRNARRAAAHERESRQRLARSYVANGNRLVNEGDPFTAMVWFAEALRLDGGIIDREASDRLRLATALRDSPKLLQVCAHGSPLTVAEFSSDGQRLLTAGRDGTLLVWSVETGRKILGPLKHPSLVSRAYFIWNDSAILTAEFGGDGARIWDAQTGKLRMFFEHKGHRRATLSPDGQWLLTWGGLDSQIKRWNARSGELLPPVASHGYVTRMLAFSPDGERFATASTERNVMLWDRAAMKPLLPPLKQQGEVRSLAFNAAGTRLFAGNWEKNIQVWNTATGASAMPPLPHPGLSTDAALALSPNGKWLASLSLEQSVRVWDADSGRLALPELRHASVPVQMTFGSRSQRLAVGCVDGSAYVWDLTGAEPASVQLKQSRKVYSVSLSPDGGRLLTASSDGTVRVWELTPDSLTISPWSERPAAVLHIGAQDKLLTQNAGHSLQLWDANTWTPAGPSIPASNAVARAWLSRDGARLVSLSFPSEAGGRLEFKTRQAASGQLLASNRAPVKSKYNLWVSPDCQLAAIAESNVVAFMEIATGAVRSRLRLETDGIRDIAFHPELPRAALVTRTELRNVDTATGRSIFPPIRLSVIGMRVAFSPDGQSLAAAYGDEFVLDREARVWDAQTGKPLTQPMEHNGAILDLVFSPDSRRLVTASHDRTARVWDARTGRALGPPLLHDAGVAHATVSADARWLATFSEAGAARVWDADTGEPLTPPLKGLRGLPGGSFLAGGKYLFAECAGGMAAIWELPRDARPVEDWQSLAMLLAARRLNPAGFLELAAPESLEAAWNGLRARYPDEFRPGHGFTGFAAAPGLSPPASSIRPVPTP